MDHSRSFEMAKAVELIDDSDVRKRLSVLEERLGQRDDEIAALRSTISRLESELLKLRSPPHRHLSPAIRPVRSVL
jgi:hypothetical protein